MIYFRLFFNFFKTGLFAVGGGMATLPFLFRIGETTGWFSVAELSNMVAVSESTPGPIGVNMATYTGYTVGGTIGAITATLGLITPSIIIILMISGFLRKFKENKAVKAVFYLLRASVVGLLAYALYSVLAVTVITDGKPDVFSLCCFFLFCIAVYFCKKVHPVVWIFAGALLGLLCF